MALELQRGRSKWWYGRVEVNGRKISRNLGVEVRGTIPASLAEMGDIAFERSRAKAQAALEKLQLDLKKRSNAEELVQTLHEIRTGARISSVPLDEIGARWTRVLRRRPLSESYEKQKVATIDRFVRFVKTTAPAIKEMAQIHAPMASAFCRAELARGVAPKTYNHLLIHLRSVFHVLRKDAGIAENPFESIPLQDGETVFRKPFTVEELSILEEKAKADPFIYPLIVTGMCTAMRRGDCCTLLRSSVDLEGGFVTVKTAKTGETVQIPIFPLLRSVLEKALAKSAPRAPYYVFPELESHYRINPDHLTDRVRRVMKAAGFFNAKGDDSTSRGAVQQEREHGLRKASLRDFHSFRVTWVTVALTAGVPLEIVQKVTGHRTTAIVLKHYFQPGREEFRRTLAGRLPALLGDRSVAPAEAFNLGELRSKLVAMEATTWKAIRDELLSRLPAEKNVTPPTVRTSAFAA